jgi:hypothetical protein
MYRHVSSGDIYKIIDRLHFKFFKKRWIRRASYKSNNVKHITKLQNFCESANIPIEKSLKILMRAFKCNGMIFRLNMMGSGFHAKYILKEIESLTEKHKSRETALEMLLEDDHDKIKHSLIRSAREYRRIMTAQKIHFDNDVVTVQVLQRLVDMRSISSYFIVINSHLYGLYKKYEIRDERIDHMIEFLSEYPKFYGEVRRKYTQAFGVVTKLDKLVDYLWECTRPIGIRRLSYERI